MITEDTLSMLETTLKEGGYGFADLNRSQQMKLIALARLGLKESKGVCRECNFYETDHSTGICTPCRIKIVTHDDTVEPVPNCPCNRCTIKNSKTEIKPGETKGFITNDEGSSGSIFVGPSNKE